MLPVKAHRVSIGILLVENDPSDARRVVETLGELPEASFFVDTVHDVAAARRHLSSHAVEAVLFGLSLPDRRGNEAVAELRGSAPRVPIIVLTSLENEQTALDAFKHGAQDYLVKGQIDARSLAHAIRSAIQRKLVADHFERRAPALGGDRRLAARVDGREQVGDLRGVAGGVQGRVGGRGRRGVRTEHPHP